MRGKIVDLKVENRLLKKWSMKIRAKFAKFNVVSKFEVFNKVTVEVQY